MCGHNKSSLKPSIHILLVTYFAFDLDLRVCQPSSYFFHKCQVKQMIFKPTEQNKNKTEFPDFMVKAQLQGLQQERLVYLGSQFFVACLKTYTFSFHAEKKMVDVSI